LEDTGKGNKRETLHAFVDYLRSQQTKKTQVKMYSIKR